MFLLSRLGKYRTCCEQGRGLISSSNFGLTRLKCLFQVKKTLLLIWDFCQFSFTAINATFMKISSETT